LEYNGFMGWPFFSNGTNDMHQIVKRLRRAKTFADATQAQEFVDELNTPPCRGGFSDPHFEPFPDDLRFIPVDTNDEYASVETCVAAGVPTW
jgi:hypothetical protein